MKSNLNEEDPLVAAFINIYRKNIQAKKDALMQFQSEEEILVHLANSSPKEREKFLKPWKDKTAKPQAGRKKNDDFAFFKEMHTEKYALEAREGKELSMPEFLRSYYKEKYPEMTTDKADQKIRTALNRISKIESRNKKIIAQIK